MKIRQAASLAFLLVFASGGCEPLDDETPEAPDPVEPIEPIEPVDPLRKVGPITEISPKTALLGQKLTVTIKIGGDKPGQTSDVSFGPGIDVIKAVEIPGGLAVDIIVEPDADSGTRDVTVTPDDAPALSAPKGFVVASAMDVTVAGGKPEQGGLVRLNLATKDGRQLAGATFELESLLDTGTSTLFQVARGVFTTTTGSVVMLGDPAAKTGLLSFLGTNNAEDPNSPAFFAADAVTVTPRTPVLLTSGVLSNISLPTALQTAFYTANLTPQGGEGLLVDAHAKVPGGSTLKPVVYAYPATGKLDDVIDVKQDLPAAGGAAATEARVAYPVTTATKGFFVVFDKDLAGTATSNLSFDFRTFRATIIPEAGAAHAIAAPQDLGVLPAAGDALPGRIVTGTLIVGGEVDAYVLSGFPAGVRDIQVSIVSEAEVDVIVDHVPSFDDDPTTFSNVDRAASGTTTGFIDPNRYIQVIATPGAVKKIGKYTLSVRAVN